VGGIPERLLLRLQVEDFLYQEANLLDEWRLKDWLQLFTPDARYEIAPLGDPEPLTVSTAEALFLVADDRERLEQRVIRLLKVSAHAEYPHSRVRHVVSNVQVHAVTHSDVEVRCNFVTFRNKRGVTATYMGQQRYLLEPSGAGFLIRLKRNMLDLDALVPQGKVSLIL
jgi:p-cumate 2,3-dioxygenase subunit beta